VNESGEEVLLNDTGQIAVRAPQVMSGYWNDREGTARVLREGWLLTGVRGSMDHHGYVFIDERR
jgi:long-chain acyl-CoA synthetase